MCVKKFHYKFIMLFLTIPNLITSGPASSADISTKPSSVNYNISEYPQKTEQLQQKGNDYQNAQLNSLNVYASNYEVISNDQNRNEKFKPSYKLPEMETNFTPIRNSVSPEFASSLGSHPPVLMQYLPQTMNEGGVQYLQLIPTRPIMVPIGSYLTRSNGLQSLAYHQHLTPSNSIEYAAQPLLSPLSGNMLPTVSSPLVDVSPSPLPSFGIQSYAGNISPYKQNHRTNRETKNKHLLGPINLNINEYIPLSDTQHQFTFNIPGRP